MAELVFRVKADYEQAIKLREELNRLESEMKKVDASTKDGQDQLAQLTKEYSETGDKLKSIAEKAAEAGYVMSNEFGAKLADAKKQVIDLSVELVNAQKELDRLKNSGKATPQQIQDAEKKISDLSEALVKAEENYKDYTDSANKAGKGTKSLTEYSKAYNTIMRMLPGPIRSVVGGFRSLSGAALKFIATPLGAALLAVSAAFKGVSYWLNNTTSGMLAKQKWTKTLADTTEKWADKLGIVTKRMKELSDATASGAAAQITAYRSLQRQWEQANGVLEKQKEVLKSDEWKKLGISISGVNDAEDVLVSKSKNVVEALMARAKAAAIYKKIEEDVQEALKSEDATNKENEKDETDRLARQRKADELNARAREFRLAEKNAGADNQGIYDLEKLDWYYLDKNGGRHYRGDKSDTAWGAELDKSYRQLRGIHRRGYFGSNSIPTGVDAYKAAADRLEKEAGEWTRLAGESQHKIDDRTNEFESYVTKIADDLDKYYDLNGLSQRLLSGIGANGDTTAQDENTRAIEKKRRRDAEDVELATTTARISTMKDGTEKTIAQINLNKRKEEIAIRRAYEDLREKKIEEEKKAFESNPDNKNLTFTYDYNSDKYAPTVAEVKKFLAEKNAIEANAAKATKDALFQEEEAMYSYLKEYGNYWEKRLATVRHYNGLIERAATDGERKRLENEKEEELNRMRAERTAFRAKSGDPDDMIEAANAETRAELERLIKKQEKLLGYIESATDGLKDAKTRLGETMSEMFNGNVDLTKRPQIPATMLADAGWSDNGPSAQEIEDINSQIADIQKQIGDIVPQDAFENVTKLTGEIDEIKNKIVSIPGLDVLSTDAIATLAQYISMLNSLKDDKDKLVSEREDVSKSIATVYSMDFDVRDASGEMHKILVTPILKGENGEVTVLSPDSLQEYIGDTIDGAENILSADNKGIVIGVDIKPGDGDYLHKLQEQYYNMPAVDVEQHTDFINRVEWIYPDADANALARPYLDAQKLISNGWKDEENKPVFSEVYDVNNNSRKIVVTPVLPNGDVMTKEEVDNYISSVLDGSEDLKSADSLGIVIGVDIDDNTLKEMQNLQNVHYSIFGLDNKEELETLKEELLLYQERGRLIVLQNNLRIAELEKERADKYGTKAEQVEALRKLLDSQSALIKDDKQRDIFKAGGNVQIARAQYGNWQDYDTYDEAVEAAQKVYDAKKAELKLREDNLGLMNLETQHANDMFNIELKFNKDLATIFGNVSRYTREQLANAKAIAQATLKAGKVNGQALTPNQIKDIQEALNGIIDAEAELPFRSGNNDLFGMIKNVQILISKQKELAGMTDTTSEAYKELAKEIEQRKSQLSLDAFSTSMGVFSEGLNIATNAISRLATASGSEALAGVAESMEQVGGIMQKTMAGFAAGGPYGAIAGAAIGIGEQVVNAFVGMAEAAAKSINAAEKLHTALRSIALDETLKKDLDSIFGSSFDQRIENARNVLEYTSDIGTRKSLVDSVIQANAEAIALQLSGGSPADYLIGTIMGPVLGGIGSALFRQSKDYEDAVNKMEAYREMIGSAQIRTEYSKGFLGIGRSQTFQSLSELAAKENVELFDKNGVVNVDFLRTLSQTYDTLTDDEKSFIDAAITDAEAYRDAVDQVKSSLSSLFSSTSSALADATIEGLHNGATMGAADMKRILSGTAKELQKSMVESIYAKYMSKFEDVMINGIMEKSWTEEDIMYQYSELLNNMGPTIQMAQNAAMRMEEMGEAMGFDMSGLQNATPSQASYQTVSETTGTAIDGRLTSLQISAGEQTGLLGMMNMSMSRMLEQVSNGARIADDVRNILTDSYLELVEIRKNTGDNVSELKLVKQMVATIEEHTRRL